MKPVLCFMLLACSLLVAQDQTVTPAPLTCSDDLHTALLLLQMQQEATNAKLDKLLALADSPKPKHKKIVKILLIAERVLSDAGGAASVSSVLGIAKASKF